MEAVVRSEHGWSRKVWVAVGFRGRLAGLRDSRAGDSVLMRTRSVHGFGMRHPLLVVGLDADMTVMGTRILHPNRVIAFPGARYLLEMPVDAMPPNPGVSLEVVGV